MSEKFTEIINFASNSLPQPYENRSVSDTNYVQYGTDNLYPNFLIEMYGKSPIHASIINGKATYIIGDGLRTKTGNVNIKVNASDTFNEFISKLVKDYLIFNYYAVEVIKNSFSQVIELHHIPAHSIRTNKSKTKFWYNEDWSYSSSSKKITYDRYNPNTSSVKSEIFFFDGYFPSVNNVYPVPEYQASLKSISTDIAIRDFNYNQIKNHFSPSSIITFFNGANIPEENKRYIIKQLKDSYSGENGGKVIVDFQSMEGKASEVNSLSAGDWDKAYIEVAKNVSNDIFIGHSVTSPMLFGVKTEGQLGGATELETAYEIFKNNYIINKRGELISGLSTLFNQTGLITERIEFIDKSLFNASVSDELKEKIYTINELRKEAGLPPLSNGNNLLSQLDKINNSPASFNSEDERGELKHLSDEDYLKISHLGVLRSDFDMVEEGEFITSKEQFNQIELKFDMQEDVSKYLIENSVDNIDIKKLRTDIRKELGHNLTETDLNDILSSLKKAGVIDYSIEDNKLSVKKNDKQPERSVTVMYSYEVRPGLGAPIIATTRPFCEKMCTNNRFYTRKEIQSMSEIFGYDIYSHGGGFYHNSKTGVTTPYCRHQFKSYTVVKKK